MKKQTKEELEKLTVKELREVAKKNTVSLTGKSKKNDIIEALLEASLPTVAPKSKSVKQKITKIAKKTPKAVEKKTPVKKVVAKKVIKQQTVPQQKNVVSTRKTLPKQSVVAVKKVTSIVEKERLSARGRKESKFENIDQSVVEQAAKFYIAKEEPVYKNDVPSFVPEISMCSNITLIIRDLGTLFAYWHVSESVLADAKGKLTSVDGLSMMLRVVQVDSGSFYEVDVPVGVSNRYLESPDNNCTVNAQLGFRNSSGEFALILESNTVYIPAEHEGHETAATEAENALYAMSLGVSEEEIEGMKIESYERFNVGSEEFLRQKLQEQVSSHLVSSISSGDSVKVADRGFRLWVDAELIVYGETEPDATVTIANKKITLKPDGSFSFRMAFPDGEIPFPVKAESSDGVEEREIDLLFKRNTKAFPPRFKH